MKKIVSFYIDSVVLNEFIKICDREDLVRSRVLEKCIADFIQEKNNGEKK